MTPAIQRFIAEARARCERARADEDCAVRRVARLALITDLPRALEALEAALDGKSREEIARILAGEKERA